nr:hypothetical protein B0A51_07797 [Rachicladosporium sp. CCFEE 5018]
MPWRPLPSVAFAICTYPFNATQLQDLPLQVGDHTYIIEQGGKSGDWYRGYLVASPSLLAGLNKTGGQQLEHRVFAGIFPRNCVEVREFLGKEAVSSDGAPKTPPTPQTPGVNGEDETEIRERRKSQKLQARRLSRALSRKRSHRSVGDKPKLQTPDLTQDPVPRSPGVAKPAAPVPLLRVGDETGQSAEEPLVDEIASCLREWHDARLHELLLARKYNCLGEVQDLIRRLDVNRKQLMHDVMTSKELSKLREDAVWDLVAGNKLLSDEVIVRSPNDKGRILTAEDSVIEMTKQQANMSILDRPPKPPLDIHMLYHVLVDVKTFVCEQSDTQASLQVSVYSKVAGEKPRPLTENFTISTPLSEAETKSPEEQAKTLFVGLNAIDLSIGNQAGSVYLVFKLLREEPVRTRATQESSGHQHQASTSSNVQPRNSLRTRRSMFGSQRRSNDARPNTANEAERPETGMSSGTVSDQSSVKDGKTVKRTIGVGVVDISDLTRKQSETRSKVTMWGPAHSFDARGDEGEDWQEIVRELGRSVTHGYTKLELVKRFDVSTTVFASADLDTLVRTTPTLLYNIHPTHKLGFSGAPDQPRSDIYLTLTEPMIPRHAHLQHSKFGSVPLNQRCNTALANLQLTLEVRKADGERVEECIFTSSNHQGHTAWRTTAVERGESWNQTIRLAIPAEDVPGSHIVMSIADSPNFPFALAWIPLWETEAFVRDGDHSVALYVYDEYSSSMIGGKGAYLALPPWHNKGDFTQVSAASVLLRTYLCSTEYSQDPSLLGLLRWRNFHGAQLVELLERFQYIPEVEIVKLLPDVFQSLFEIMDEYANSEAYEDLLLYNFVVIFGIAKDRRFDLGNVIEQYATTRHDWPYASQCLLRAFHRLITNPLDPEGSRKLRAALKVGDQLLRLIIETRKETTDVNGTDTNGHSERHPTFSEDLGKLFVALMALMRNPMPVLLGTQTLVIQHFHSWLPELESLMSPSDVLEVATDLLDAGAHAQGKMIMRRLVLIINYSNLAVFKDPDTRTRLIANTYRWLEPYWGTREIVTDQWRNQVRLCCSVVAAQMAELDNDGCQYVPKLVESYTTLQAAGRRSPSRTFTLLFPTTFPFPERRTSTELDVDKAMLEMSALLATALTTQQRLYLDSSTVDVPGVLLQALKVGQSILSCEAFPKSWVSLHVSHHRYGMMALQRIQELLIESLPDIYATDANEAFDFDTVIWRQFFDTLFVAVSSPALAMETFPEQKRRAIWKIAGDVRETGAVLLKQSWEAIGWETPEESKKLHGFQRMGGYQVQFMPELVAPVVELCLSMHATLRQNATEVLRSMIVSAWELDQDLGVVQRAVIECLDRLCRRKDISEAVLQKSFVAELLEQFKPLQNSSEDELYRAVVEMFRKVDELLSMLGTVHSGTAISEATQIVDTLRLMEFLRDVQSDAAYIRYVHQLADMQSKAGNHTEAGLALQLHAEKYAWDASMPLDPMEEPGFPAQKSFDRREALCFQMIQHYERGAAYQKGLTVYKELAHQYETNTFDFVKLARTQRAMAAMHERIAKGDRVFARYFRVLHRGHGWPTNVRDKEFIFEGHASDKLAVLEDKIRQLHPGASILRNNAEADLVEGQYLQVFPVSVHRDLSHMVYQRTKVAQTVRDYYLLSSPQRFSTTTRQPVRELAITEQPVEKTLYTTVAAFPTILRRAEIVATEKVALTAIEAAVERTTRKTAELVALEKRVSSGDEGAMQGLSEAILLSVDPESSSSVARYRGLIPTAGSKDAKSDEFDPSAPEAVEDGPVELDSMQSALQVALLDHALVIKRCLGLYNRNAHLATRAELVPRFEAMFEYELSVLFPGQSGVMDLAALRDSQEPVTEPPDSRQATAGAEVSEPNGVDAPSRGRESSLARGRRRSLSFLKRGSIASLRGQKNAQTNGVNTGSEEVTTPRARSSSRGPFGFFERRPSSSAGGGADGVGRKRLSFLGNGT